MSRKVIVAELCIAFTCVALWSVFAHYHVVFLESQFLVPYAGAIALVATPVAIVLTTITLVMCFEAIVLLVIFLASAALSIFTMIIYKPATDDLVRLLIILCAVGVELCIVTFALIFRLVVDYGKPQPPHTRDSIAS